MDVSKKESKHFALPIINCWKINPNMGMPQTLHACLGNPKLTSYWVELASSWALPIALDGGFSQRIASVLAWNDIPQSWESVKKITCFFGILKDADGKTLVEFLHLPVADPGFPRGGDANPKVGAPTYYLVKNFPKTAWQWKNLDRGRARPWGPL